MIEAGDTIELTDENLKQDFERIKNLNNNYKSIACMLLMRNKLDEGFEKITNLLSSTVHERSNTFDKAMVLILNNCVKNLQNEFVSEVKKNKYFIDSQ